MRLKSLELAGFKSFFDPTIINFSPGVTAVVGPNGCGKSNVVDGIRWVLGEQAPTRLRGKSLEDLLYLGNDSNPAAGMAEVTLTLEAVEGSLLPAPYENLSEVAVTRRAYRSGESEYQLNKLPCRLKDITEFFMAAQIHSRGYALVEQGRIDEIIQAKPNEIRTMVEEAAGLALFKGRREMSERKLERVRENLARIDDVLKEIERQLAYARRQAKKAESYRLLRAELIELEHLAEAQRILALKAELEQHSVREISLQTEANALRELHRERESAFEQYRTSLTELHEKLAAAERELAKLSAAREERSRARTFLARRADTLNQLARDLAAAEPGLRAGASAARAARAAAGARLARILNTADPNGEAQLDQQRRDLRDAERALKSAERQLEDRKDGLAEILRDAAVARGRLAGLAGERAEGAERLGALTGEAETLSAQLAGLRAAAAAAHGAAAAARSRLTQAEAEQRHTTEREFALRNLRVDAARRLEMARDALAAARLAAKPISAASAQQRLDAVLTHLNGDGPATPPAMLLDVIKAPAGLEPALRAILGDQLDAALVDSTGFALRAVEILKQSDGGRLSFLKLGDRPAAPAHAKLEAAGISGRLLEMVDVQPGFERFAESLLGHVMLAEGLNAACAAARLNGSGTVFVTRDGDLLMPERMISGGSRHNQSESTATSMRQHRRNLVMAAHAVRLAEDDVEELTRAADWAQLAVHDDLNDLSQARRELLISESAAIDARDALGKVEQRAALIDVQRGSLEGRLRELADLATHANAQLENFARAEQAARSDLSAAADGVSGLRETLVQLSGQISTLTARLTEHKNEAAAAGQELRHSRELAAAAEAQLLRHQDEVNRAGRERRELVDELELASTQEEAARAQHQELRQGFDLLTTRRRELTASTEAARRALDETERDARAVTEQLRECQFAIERARTLSTEIERAFEEKFHAAFETCATDLEARLRDRDPERDRLQLEELRARAERIGEVNLAADGEVKELEERSAHLGAERADLQSAADDLTQTITKLNREARKRFADTFDGAARNFAELFPKLMRGGRGHLELIASDDVLEAGVNILVQPPGKRVKEIGLLSGGEKALSAMALIFSLFLLNPSPFCILDEVDAPLDEFSLAAFTSLVGELKARSQFIIITHNQRTMQAADQIHGVTMERPGISRLISLRIPQAA